MDFRTRLKKIFEGPKHARGYKSPELYQEKIIAVLKKYAKENDLPVPTEILDTGTEAVVFKSTDDNILIRAEQIVSKNDSCEFLMHDLQETGGTAKIYHLAVKNVNVFENKRFNYVFTWKELVDIDIEGYLNKKYDEETASEIITALYYMADEDNLENLKKYPETEGLAKAVEKGLDSRDLMPGNNIGYTKDGRIVAFDC